MSRIRLLIVDDHEVVRLGLRTLLEGEPDLKVVAEAGTAEEALIQTENHRPDVVILDIQLPGRSGLDACRDIRKQFPQTQVVMLTSSVSESFALEALRAGAAGYVLKQVGNDELVRAIRAAHNGETALDPKTAARLVARLNELQKKTEADAFRDLSPREMDVLVLVSRGASNKEIGLELNLSEITARNYVTAIMEKLHLRNRVELAAYAIRNHIEERL
ncbi:MAG: response regulator transcription factor [Chloroflexota bacterium]